MVGELNVDIWSWERWDCFIFERTRPASIIRLRLAAEPRSRPADRRRLCSVIEPYCVLSGERPAETWRQRLITLTRKLNFLLIVVERPASILLGCASYRRGVLAATAMRRRLSCKICQLIVDHPWSGVVYNWGRVCPYQYVIQNP